MAYAHMPTYIHIKHENRKGDKVNMCKAIQDWMAEEREAEKYVKA